MDAGGLAETLCVTSNDMGSNVVDSKEKYEYLCADEICGGNDVDGWMCG